MDLVTRFALVSLVCAFILNAVVTIQNFEKDRAITALGKELDSLRFQVKADRDLHMVKDAAQATASTQAQTYGPLSFALLPPVVEPFCFVITSLIFLS